MGRCMLLDGDMPKMFWAEAINTACYLQNRLPSAAVDRTPFEIWFGRKPDMSHLRLFGSIGYVMVPSVKRKKLDLKAIKMTFVGYSNEHKAYRMIDVKTGEMAISRDVRFIEFGENQKSEAHPQAELRESTNNPEIEWTIDDKQRGGRLDSDSEEEFYGCDDDENE